MEAIYQKAEHQQAGHPDHKVYPYLLRGLAIERPNQVWCADITYIPMAKGFLYLVAVMDWFSRRVLAMAGVDHHGGGLSASRRSRRRLARHGQPETLSIPIKESSSPAPGFSTSWKAAGIRVSMDGKGRFLDNIFIERLWRSLNMKRTCSSKRMAQCGGGACQSIGGWLRFYNEERLHQALGYRTPCAVFDGGEAREPVDNTSALLRAAAALPTGSRARSHQEKESNDLLT